MGEMCTWVYQLSQTNPWLSLEVPSVSHSPVKGSATPAGALGFGPDPGM